MKRFLLALQFLTTLPVKNSFEPSEKDYGKAMLYFPIVGLLLGIILAIATLTLSFLPQGVVVTFIVIILVILTGAIHLDGLADSCDGLYGMNSRDRRLEIMRDSHIGTMGVVGLVCILLLKFTVIANISSNFILQSLIMMMVFSRCSQVLVCYMSRYVRNEGKAKAFIEYVGKRELAVGGIFTLLVFFLLAQFKGLIIFFFALCLVLLFTAWVKKKIGGATGDTIGATSEISEVIVLLLTLLIL